MAARIERKSVLYMDSDAGDVATYPSMYADLRRIADPGPAADVAIEGGIAGVGPWVGGS